MVVNGNKKLNLKKGCLENRAKLKYHIKGTAQNTKQKLGIMERQFVNDTTRKLRIPNTIRIHMIIL
mgnify:CR=1 FL=1